MQICVLQAAAEGRQPVYLELARYLAPGTDTLTDPAFEVYHGVAALAVPEQLSEPGQTKADLQAVVTMAYLEAQQAGTLPQPGLPRPDPPANPKARQLACLQSILLLAEMQEDCAMPLLSALELSAISVKYHMVQFLCVFSA
ncbi:hypothetical protein ABBQ38_007426 [Trebouxia sp. C0009 RCD-2024]